LDNKMGNMFGCCCPAAEIEDIPEMMRRLQIAETALDMDDVKMEVVQVPVPVPKSGQVLVRMVAAPVNPSDYGDWRRKPEAGKKAAALGKEGCGVVVRSGGGCCANDLMGKRVGVISIKGGTYSEYLVTDAAMGAFALPDEVATEEAASFFVNPFTACGFVHTVKGMGKTGFVSTAAASQLGQQLVQLCKTEGLTVINVVRREEQAELLRGLGAEHIVVSSDKDWKDQLRAKMADLKISVIFDAIAGDNTGEMVDICPPKGTTFLFGGLSEKAAAGINPMDLIYKQKKLEGWLLTHWIQGGGNCAALCRLRWAKNLVMPGLHNGWSASKFEDCSMDEMMPTFLEMRKPGGGFTNKKLRIRFDKEFYDQRRVAGQQ